MISASEHCDVFLSPFAIELKRMKARGIRGLTPDDINCVQPDLLVLCDYEDDINEEDRYKGTPTLVVEILSPSSRSHDMVRKLGLYEESGIREYWVIDPEHKTVLIYSFEEFRMKEYVVRSESGIVS